MKSSKDLQSEFNEKMSVSYPVVGIDDNVVDLPLTSWQLSQRYARIDLLASIPHVPSWRDVDSCWLCGRQTFLRQVGENETKSLDTSRESVSDSDRSGSEERDNAPSRTLAPVWGLPTTSPTTKSTLRPTFEKQKTHPPTRALTTAFPTFPSIAPSRRPTRFPTKTPTKKVQRARKYSLKCNLHGCKSCKASFRHGTQARKSVY